MFKNILISIFIVVLAAIALWFFLSRNPKPVNESIASTATTTLGFIRSIDATSTTIQFDDAIWLSGKAGEDAAIAAGNCTENNRSECLPNDFYILNTSTSTVSLSIATNTPVIMQTLYAETSSVSPSEISFAHFAKLISTPGTHWNILPYKVTTKNGVVTKIEEVYVP